MAVLMKLTIEISLNSLIKYLCINVMQIRRAVIPFCDVTAVNADPGN